MPLRFQGHSAQRSNYFFESYDYHPYKMTAEWYTLNGMGKKSGPYILFAVLVLILIFILGVRYGQNVEKTNKKISFIVSIAPTKPVPTEKPLNFTTHTSKGCALEFLYPSVLSVLRESTTSAEFGKDKKIYLKYSCEPHSAVAPLGAGKIATPSFSFQNKKIVAQKTTKDGLIFHSFSVRNPVINQDIRFTVEEKFLPLFEKTLKFGVQNEKN